MIVYFRCDYFVRRWRRNESLQVVTSVVVDLRRERCFGSEVAYLDKIKLFFENPKALFRGEKAEGELFNETDRQGRSVGVNTSEDGLTQNGGFPIGAYGDDLDGDSPFLVR